MDKNLSALVLRDTGMNNNDLLKSKLPKCWNIDVLSIKEDKEEISVTLPSYDVIVGGRIGMDIPRKGNLKLYQVPFTGIDWINPGELPEGVPLCNTYEHETTIAEHLLGAMIEWQTGLMRDTDKDMRSNSFNNRSINKGPHHLEMMGSTVGIIGLGRIGVEVAKRSKIFGMKVMAVSRSRKDPESFIDWVGQFDEIEKLLKESDFIIVTLPGGEQTKSFINHSFFRMMKPQAVIANVGRGEVIHEAALYEALASRRIRGAIIDVWYNYPSISNPNPWPSRFPIEKLDNVIMSPHNSAWTLAMSNRRWEFVAANLTRLADDEPLENICFIGERVD